MGVTISPVWRSALAALGVLVLAVLPHACTGENSREIKQFDRTPAILTASEFTVEIKERQAQVLDSYVRSGNQDISSCLLAFTNLMSVERQCAEASADVREKALLQTAPMRSSYFGASAWRSYSSDMLFVAELLWRQQYADNILEQLYPDLGVGQLSRLTSPYEAVFCETLELMAVEDLEAMLDDTIPIVDGGYAFAVHQALERVGRR